jgi:hypothetical protein
VTVPFPYGSAYEKVLADGEEIAPHSIGNQTTLTLQFGKKGARESQPICSVPSMHMEGQQGLARTLNISLSANIPSDFQVARMALLLEPDQKAVGVEAQARTDGKPAAVAVEMGGQGFWYWMTTDLSAGSHTLEFSLHLPLEMRGRVKISGWLRGKRLLVKKDIQLRSRAGQTLSAPPEDVLPTSSQFERETYPVFEEVVP